MNLTRYMPANYLVLASMCAVLVVYQFIPWSPVSLLSLALFIWLAYQRLDLALGFVLLAVPFYLLHRSFGPVSLSPVEVLILGCGIAWVARRIVHRKRGLPRSMFDGPLLLILLAAFISMFVGDHLRESLRVLRTVILEPILFYVMLIDTVKRPASIMWCIIALIVGGCLISLVAIAQWVSASNVITAEGVIRSRGFYGSPNNLGLVLERTIPLAACGVIVFRDYRWWWAGASALMLVAVVLTFSWGAWFALGVSALFLGFVGGRRRAMVVLVSVISVMAALLLLAGPERLASHLSLEQGTTFIRLRLWEASLLMLRDHPLFGVGLDNFLYLYRELYVFDDAIIDLELSHPHNIVLDYWLNLGILGLFAGGWLLWRFFNVGWRSYNYLPETSRRALVLGLLASMIAAFTHGLVDNFFFLVDLAVLFWFMCAMMHTLSGKNEGMEWI